MKTDKNIWLIPTKNKALLFKDHTGFYKGIRYQFASSINSSVEGLDIYITNDDKIEKGDYYIDSLTNIAYMAGVTPVTMACFKKIIITSDLDIISFVQCIELSVLQWFCQESNKNNKPINFIKTNKVFPDKNSVCHYETIIPKEKEANWIEAFTKSSEKKITSVTFSSVKQLNEDGTETDITDKPELWHIKNDKNHSIVDTSNVSEIQEKRPLYGDYFINNLQEIAESLVDRNTNASIESPYRKTLEKYVLLGLNHDENKITFDDMQYYMEYCQRNGYITPQEWITNHKHY